MTDDLCAFPNNKFSVVDPIDEKAEREEFEYRLHDSGQRTTFETGAKRDTNQGKGLPREIPPTILMRVAGHFELGAKKYDVGNWRKGIPVSRYLDAIARHSWAVALGQTDEDHVAALAWNSLCMGWTLEQIEAGRLPLELDDRPYKGTSCGSASTAKTGRSGDASSKTAGA